MLLLLMLSGGVVFIARQNPQKFIFQLSIWGFIFLTVFLIVGFFVG